MTAWRCLGLIGLLVLGGLGRAEPPAPPPPEETRLPAATPQVSGAALLRALAEGVDLGDRHGLLELAADLPSTATLQATALERLAAVTGGALRGRQEGGEIVLEWDRQAWQLQEVQLRSKVATLAAEWFPNQAQAARRRFGVVIYQGQQPPFALGHGTPPARLVLLIHGVDEPGYLWRDLRPALLADGAAVGEATYPNDQPIARSAEFVAGLLGQLRQAGVTEVALVAHSMGGLVSRDVLTRPGTWYDGHGRGHAALPDVTHLIMVGTPNQGSELARLRLASETREQLCRWWRGQGTWLGSLFDGAGEAQVDLLPESAFLRDLNARPLPTGVHLAIVAGRISPVTQPMLAALPTWLPRLTTDAAAQLHRSLATVADGVGDGCVPLASARLAGVTDYQEVAGNHQSMLCRLVPGRGEAPPAIAAIRKSLQQRE